jgi:hypothetical protein
MGLRIGALINQSARRIGILELKVLGQYKGCTL